MVIWFLSFSLLIWYMTLMQITADGDCSHEIKKTLVPWKKSYDQPQFSSVQLLSCVWFFATPWTAARQASLSIANYQCLLKLMSIQSVMPSNHLIFCSTILRLPQSFPSSGSFQMSQLVTSGGQSIVASFKKKHISHILLELFILSSKSSQNELPLNFL